MSQVATMSTLIERRYSGGVLDNVAVLCSFGSPWKRCVRLRGFGYPTGSFISIGGSAYEARLACCFDNRFIDRRFDVVLEFCIRSSRHCRRPAERNGKRYHRKRGSECYVKP